MSKTFAHWLRAQTRRDDPIGDLARDVTGDVRSGCLTRITSPAALREHIERVHNGDDHVLAAVGAACVEWLLLRAEESSSRYNADPRNVTLNHK